MIQPSQRRSTPTHPDELLAVHERIARQRRRTRRLWWASALACAVSVVLWLLGVSVLWHLTLVGLALVTGLFLPLGSTVTWALDWVSRHLGLSYVTALDLSEAPPDSYGFHEAVRERAAAGAAKLELPQQQPWWLPLLVIALVLAILPVVPFRSAPRLSLGNPPTAPEQTPDSPDATSPQVAETPAEETEEPEQPSDQGATTPEEADPSTSTVDDFSTAGNEGSQEGAGEGGDEEALSNFMDNLSERPPPEEQTNPFSSVNPQGGTPNEGEAGERGEAQPAQSGQPPQDATRQEGQQEGTPQSAEASEDGSEQGSQGEEGEGEEGQAEGSQAGEEPGEEQGEDAAASSGEQGEEEGTEQASGEPSDGEEGEGQEGEASGESQSGIPSDEGAPEEGEMGNSAGNAPGAPTPTDPERLEAPGTPEQLRGRLGAGPSSTAGSARLQGTPEGDAAAPGGAAPQTFNQADEQAITEGRIPVEYQDIIRDYFR